MFSPKILKYSLCLLNNLQFLQENAIIHPDPGEVDVYFTTDGNEPDPFNRHSSGGKLVTHRYKVPFTLKPGRRAVRAVAVTKYENFPK